MSNHDQDEDLFGNDSDDSQSSSEGEQNKDQNVSTFTKESDVDENDKYGEEDYFNSIDSEGQNEYKKTSPFPSVPCPGEKILENYDRGFKSQPKEEQSYFQHKFTSEKLISLENKEFERESFDLIDLNVNADYIISNYSISYSLKFDPSLSKYDNFSKKHHREKLFKLINEIDWDNEYKIKTLKKEVNPYEDVIEDFFDKRSSYKLANLNSIFKFNLFSIDHRVGYTPIMIVGDDGGYSDYIMWTAQKGDFIVKLFTIPEKGNRIYKTTFRKEIEESKDELMSILNLQKGCDLDEIENLDGDMITNLSQNVLDNTDGMGLSLFVAKKYIKFKKEFSAEIKYKKFLLLNVILGLSTLSKGGNLVIKIYDMFSQFTISVLYILYNHFEKFSIVKPFSSRPHSCSRFVVCQKLIDFKPKILDYLIDLYTKYTELIKSNRDIDFVFPISKIIKDESFTNYLMEMNSLITEQRIETLETIKSGFENGSAPKFDKMDIKKKCLDLWKVPVLHYDHKQVIITQNSKFDKKSKVNKIISIDDKDTLKLYSDYDKYSDTIQSVIDGFGSRKKQENKSLAEKELNLKSDKFESLNQSKINDTSNLSKKKVSNSTKLDALKQQIIADRKTEQFLNAHNESVKTDTSQNQEEFLRKKREMLASSFNANPRNSKSTSKSEKKVVPMTNKIKLQLDFPSRTEEKRSDKKNFQQSDSYSTNDIVKKKEQAIQQSRKNRELAENATPKVPLSAQLLAELEKHKTKKYI